QYPERRGSPGPREGPDLLLLGAVCAARSEAESQTAQGPGVWGEAQEAQITALRWDGWGWKCGREGNANAAKRSPERGHLCCRGGTREEAPSTGAWTTRG